jgi:hypothetical protein
MAYDGNETFGSHKKEGFLRKLNTVRFSRTALYHGINYGLLDSFYSELEYGSVAEQ